MKKLLKMICLAFILTLSVASLSGCSGPSATPAELTTMYLDVLTDKEGAKEALDEYYGEDSGFTAEFNIEKVKENRVAALMETDISKKDATKIVDSMFEAIKDAEYVAEDTEDLVATFSIKGINFKGINIKAGEDANKDIAKYANDDEAIAAYIKLLIKGLDNAEIVSEAREYQATFEDFEGYLLPADAEKIETDMLAGLLGF